MAQISKGDTFVDGQQVTGARLNQLVDSSVLLVGAITDQPSITANTLEATDSTIVNDGGVLKEATIGDFLNSNLPITTSSITGGAGVDITVTPAAGQKMDVGGAFEANSINAVGNSTIGGNETVSGNLAVTGTTTLTGNVTASGNLAVTGTITNAGNPIQKRVDVAVLTREETNGTYYILTRAAWSDIPYNTISQSNSFVVNSASFTGVLSSAGTGIITLPAGTYAIEAEAGLNSSGTGWYGQITSRILNDTTVTVIKNGTSVRTSEYSGNSTSTVYAVFTLSSQSNIKIQYYFASPYATATSSNALSGIPSPQPEIIFTSKITKFN